MTTRQQISRPGKVLDPGSSLTKADLAAHYERVADVMLPHLARHPLVLHRYPDGLDADGFYQKQAPEGAPLATVTVPARNERGHVEHLLVDDVEGLRYLANQAVVELHRWLSTADDLDHPDLLVIDLDPPRRRDLAALRRAARATRDLFGEIGLTPYLMATGSRGYHVVAPLDRTAAFDDVRALARALADRLAAATPDDLTTEQRIANRGNRIYLDTNRNAYAQTTVAPYSPRARPGAPVATPLGFGELSRVEPDGHDTVSVGRRLARKADPWSDMAAHAGSASRARSALADLPRVDAASRG
jgi:bifunctional non-homologous end joining protein LigD